MSFLSKRQKQANALKKVESEHRVRKLRLELESLSKPSRKKVVKNESNRYDPSADLHYEDRCTAHVSNIVGHATVKPGVMDRMYLDKESKSTVQAIKEKAMRVAPSYNRGALQYEGASIAETLKTNKRR